MEPIFKTPAEFASGLRSITPPRGNVGAINKRIRAAEHHRPSRDEALCFVCMTGFGKVWMTPAIKSLPPRRPRSNWSALNIIGQELLVRTHASVGRGSF